MNLYDLYDLAVELLQEAKMPAGIKKIIYNDPATVVFWNDNTKTVVKAAEGDTYNKTAGLALCILKKTFGDKLYKRLVKNYFED